MTSLAIQALESARSKIQRGWCQKLGIVRTDYGDAYCLSEALCASAREHSREPQVFEEMLDAVRRSHPGLNKFIDWNDAEDRTKEEVIQLLTESIEYAERQKPTNDK